MSELFRRNDYPLSVINQTIRSCTRSHYTRPKPTENITSHFYMKLPYVDEVLTKRVTAAIRSSKAPIKVSWTNNNTLKKHLVTSALTPPPCPSGHKRCHTCTNGLEGRCTTRMSIYKLTCLACEREGTTATYIGQSRRPIRARFNEHLGDARLRKSETGLGDHTLDWHTDMSNTEINKNYKIEILTTKEHEADLRICESVYIRDNNPT